MKVLIIGGTGLISSALTRQLIARGESVTVYNRGQAEASIPAAAIRIAGDRYNPARFVGTWVDSSLAGAERVQRTE